MRWRHAAVVCVLTLGLWAWLGLWVIHAWHQGQGGLPHDARAYRLYSLYDVTP